MISSEDESMDNYIADRIEEFRAQLREAESQMSRLRAEIEEMARGQQPKLTQGEGPGVY